MRFQPEPLRLERDRATASERIEYRRRIAARALQDLGACLFRGAVSSFEFSHFTSRSMSPNRRSRSALGPPRSGTRPDGRRVVDELGERTARQAASGRRAHHRCSVEGCPCRIDFSRADSLLIASSGSATSIASACTRGPWRSLPVVHPSVPTRAAQLPDARPPPASSPKVEVPEWVDAIADLVERVGPRGDTDTIASRDPAAEFLPWSASVSRSPRTLRRPRSARRTAPDYSSPSSPLPNPSVNSP